MKSKICLFALPLLLGALILSCQDEVTGASENKEKDAVLNATIEKAKAIFESMSPDFPVIQSRSSDGVEKGIVFEPVWNEAFVANHADGTTTVETHIRLSQPFHMLPQDSRDAYDQTKDGRYLQHLSRAVVLMKDDNSTPHSFLMSIVGSKKYMEKHDFQLWNVSYGNIPEDFSGQILYHALDGSFVNAWYVEEGNKYSACEPISEEYANLLSRAATDCYTYQSTYYHADCTTRKGYNFSTYEDEIYITTWGEIVCGRAYPVVETYKVCYDTNGNGSYTPREVEISDYIGSYSGISRDRLQSFVLFIEGNDCASIAISNFIKNTISSVFQPVNVAVNAIQAPNGVRYDQTTNTVYFKSVNDFTDLAMYEEIVHAVQRVVYTTVEIEEAPFNLEFEAKLIMDYARFSTGILGRTDLARNMKYMEVELQNGNVKTIAEWLNGLSYSSFDIEDYRSYMGAWKEVAINYQNYMLNLRQQPKLIFPLLDEMN